MSEGAEERVQKLIAASGLCSRREAERYIEDGKVRVNGKVASLGDKARPGTPIFVANKPIPSRRDAPVTLILNKPKGVVCTNEDPHAEHTVFDLLPPDLRRMRLFCAGRLDKDSEGIVVLTNDGSLAARLMHPGSGVIKRYRLTLHRDFDRADIPRLLEGVEDEGEHLRADKIVPAPDAGTGAARRLEVYLSHGRKRELRRLFRARGYFVKKLVRVRIGSIILRNIPKGGYKILGEKDIERLFS